MSRQPVEPLSDSLTSSAALKSSRVLSYTEKGLNCTPKSINSALILSQCNIQPFKSPLYSIQM
nr:MAG TPA: hypothetical protein [Caudoviricetes sp.]